MIKRRVAASLLASSMIVNMGAVPALSATNNDELSEYLFVQSDSVDTSTLGNEVGDSNTGTESGNSSGVESGNGSGSGSEAGSGSGAGSQEGDQSSSTGSGSEGGQQSGGNDSGAGAEQTNERFDVVLDPDGGTLADAVDQSTASVLARASDWTASELNGESGYFANPNFSRDSIVLPSATKSGQNFVGWLEAKSGTVVAPGQVWTTSTEDDAVVFQAVWAELPVAGNLTVSSSATKIMYGNADSVTLTAANEDSVGEVEYQWYEATNSSGTEGSAIDGATNETFSLPQNTEVGTHFYYATATAKMDGLETEAIKSNIVSVTVTKAKASILVERSSYDKLFGDKPFKIKPEIYAGGGEEVSASCTFESSDENVAVIGSGGTVIIVGAGSANITIGLNSENYEAKTATVRVNVDKLNQNFYFSRANVRLNIDTDTFYALSPYGARTQVFFESSDETVATVDERTGTVVPYGVGTTVITATAEEDEKYYGATASYVVTVYQNSSQNPNQGHQEPSGNDEPGGTGTDDPYQDPNDDPGEDESGNKDEDAEKTIDNASKITVTAYSGTYDGKGHNAVTISNKTSKDTITYSIDDGDTWSSTVPKVLNVKDAENMEVLVQCKRTGYKAYTLTAHPSIKRASVDMSKVQLKDGSVTYTGKSYGLKISGNLPNGVKTSYSENKFSEVGSYKVTVKFETDEDNYNPIEPLTATLTIKKAVIDMSKVEFKSQTVTYDKAQHSLEVKNLPANVTVSYKNNGQVNAGKYKVTASFNVPNANYEPIKDMTATLTINKAKYDMSSVKLGDKVYTYDGTAKKNELEGKLPDGLKVTYKDSTATNAGSKTTVASFKSTDPNYETPSSIKGTLTIKKKDASITYTVAKSNPIFGGDPSVLSYTYTGTDKVSARISGPASAQIDHNRKTVTITPNGCGTVAVTLSAPDTGNSKGASAQYTMSVDRLIVKFKCNVNDAKIVVSSGDKTAQSEQNAFLLNYGKEYSYSVSAPGYASVTKKFVAKDPNISVSLSKEKQVIVFKMTGAANPTLILKNEDGNVIKPAKNNSLSYKLERGRTYSYTATAMGEDMPDVKGKLTVEEETTGVNIAFAKNGGTSTVVNKSAGTETSNGAPENNEESIADSNEIPHFNVDEQNMDSSAQNSVTDQLPQDPNGPIGSEVGTESADTSAPAATPTNSKSPAALFMIALAALAAITGAVFFWRKNHANPEDDDEFGDNDNIGTNFDFLSGDNTDALPDSDIADGMDSFVSEDSEAGQNAFDDNGQTQNIDIPDTPDGN